MQFDLALHVALRTAPQLYCLMLGCFFWFISLVGFCVEPAKSFRIRDCISLLSYV